MYISHVAVSLRLVGREIRGLERSPERGPHVGPGVPLPEPDSGPAHNMEFVPFTVDMRMGPDRSVQGRVQPQSPRQICRT